MVVITALGNAIQVKLISSSVVLPDPESRETSREQGQGGRKPLTLIVAYGPNVALFGLTKPSDMGFKSKPLYWIFTLLL